MRRSFLFSAIMVWSLAAQALTLDQPLANPAQEAQAQQLFHALRCVVCEGQSLAESDAMLAVQMRARARQMLREGETQARILTYFRERYGDRIVMTPPLAPRTGLLWAAPLLLLLLGGVILWHRTNGKDL